MLRPLIACLLSLVSVSSLVLNAEGIREVRYTDKTPVQIVAQQRFATVIVLPKEEAIVEATCGDKEYWIVEEVKNARNAVSVKPARAGAVSNLHLVAASGRMYTFALREGSAKPDDKVVVIGDEAAFEGSTRPHYSQEEYEGLRAQLAQADERVSKSRTEATQAIESFRTQYPSQLKFDYVFSPAPSSFGVRAVWHDDRFTYVNVQGHEMPALYEEHDGQLTVPEYQVQGGQLFVVPHVVDRGYLMLGSKKWSFRRAQD
jgi:type IV secretory pathway VirB9-like protein